MSEPINRDAMHLAIRLYSAKTRYDGGELSAEDRARYQSDAVEDARELILAARKIQRLDDPSQSQQIFQRLSQLMVPYNVSVEFGQSSLFPVILLTYQGEDEKVAVRQ